MTEESDDRENDKNKKQRDVVAVVRERLRTTWRLLAKKASVVAAIIAAFVGRLGTKSGPYVADANRWLRADGERVNTWFVERRKQRLGEHAAPAQSQQAEVVEEIIASVKHLPKRFRNISASGAVSGNGTPAGIFLVAESYDNATRIWTTICGMVITGTLEWFGIINPVRGDVRSEPQWTYWTIGLGLSMLAPLSWSVGAALAKRFRDAVIWAVVALGVAIANGLVYSWADDRWPM